MSDGRDIPHTGGILVVDDDPGLASALQDLLRQDGYAVEVALSASEALAVHQRNPHLAVALVDLIMPVTGGLALMDELHRANPDLAVIIMTGFATIETAVEAVKRRTGARWTGRAGPRRQTGRNTHGNPSKRRVSGSD